MSGMNLLNMLASAQGGNAIANIGKEVGLNPAQAESAVKALLPALSSGLKRNVSQPGGLEALLGALQSGNHAQTADDPASLSNPQTTQTGNAVLGHVLGSKDVSREVANRASAATGIGNDVLKKMLPLVASMAMGSMAKQTQHPSMANLVTQALSGGGQSSGGGGLLGGLMGAVLGGGQSAPAAGNAKQGENPLMAMLDADGDGSAMDDIFNMLTKK